MTAAPVGGRPLVRQIVLPRQLLSIVIVKERVAGSCLQSFQDFVLGTDTGTPSVGRLDIVTSAELAFKAHTPFLRHLFLSAQLVPHSEVITLGISGHRYADEAPDDAKKSLHCLEVLYLRAKIIKKSVPPKYYQRIIRFFK